MSGARPTVPTNPTDAVADSPTPAPTAAPAPAEALAAIDIGTNSIHLVVARMTAGDERAPRFEVLGREREMVRLGSGGGDMKALDPDAVDRAIAAISRFRQMAEVHDAAITAVATSAVREAENRDELLNRAWRDAGVRVDVISGIEEARLIHLGVLQSVPVFDRRLVLCDIGGGSTELLVGEQGTVLASRSLKLGSIRLTRRFLEAKRLKADAVDACRSHIRSTLAPFAREIRRLEVEVAVGSSGTIGAIVDMAARRSTGAKPKSASNLVVTRPQVDEVVAELVDASTVEARAKLAGLDPRRADIIVAGALILEQVMDTIGLEKMTFSDAALREGVLLDAWRRHHGGSLHHLSDLRRRSVVELTEQMDEDPGHSEHVAALALELFDATRHHHDLGDDARELFEAAALLCNIGLSVSHAGHHKHSYYLIRNSEHLSGFTDHEVEVIALVARYHRKSAPKAKHPEYAALHDDDQRRVRTLAALLRVAIGLDRNHSGRVQGVEVVDEDGELIIVAQPRPGKDIDLELYAATARVDLLETALDRPVRITSPTGRVGGRGRR
ncbi:Ppx/GppA phosphatase family protein [soil metagenome]